MGWNAWAAPGRPVAVWEMKRSVLLSGPAWKKFGVIGGRKVRLAAAERRNCRQRASPLDLAGENIWRNFIVKACLGKVGLM